MTLGREAHFTARCQEAEQPCNAGVVVRGALSFGGAQPGHITQNSLQGDKHHAGLVARYELKWKVPRKQSS